MSATWTPHERARFATKAAYTASDAARLALLACEEAMEQLDAQQRRIAVVREAVRAAGVALTALNKDLNVLIWEQTDAAVQAGPTGAAP